MNNSNKGNVILNNIGDDKNSNFIESCCKSIEKLINKNFYNVVDEVFNDDIINYDINIIIINYINFDYQGLIASDAFDFAPLLANNSLGA